MQYGIAFTPLVPTIVLWIALAAIVAISVLLLLGRVARGCRARRGAGADPAGARQPLLHARGPRAAILVAGVVIDKSPSQNFGTRNQETAKAQEALVDTLKKIKGLEVRVVEAGQADGEDRRHQAVRRAVLGAVGRFPSTASPARSCITDGRVHDIPPTPPPSAFQAAGARAWSPGARTSATAASRVTAAPRFGIVGQPQTITYRLDDQGVTASAPGSWCAATAR
jgi:hypothetical protein